jgi:hypothetical protein
MGANGVCVHYIAMQPIAFLDSVSPCRVNSISSRYPNSFSGGPPSKGDGMLCPRDPGRIVLDEKDVPGDCLAQVSILITE